MRPVRITYDPEGDILYITFGQPFVRFCENMGRMGLGHFKQNPSIPSFQHGGLESRSTWTFPDASLRAWLPAIHAGMTVISISILCGRA
jgi:Protein of unknown function (DUF2283)